MQSLEVFKNVRVVNTIFVMDGQDKYGILLLFRKIKTIYSFSIKFNRITRLPHPDRDLLKKSDK